MDTHVHMQALRDYVQRVRSLAASFKKGKPAEMIHKVGVWCWGFGNSRV